MSRESLLLDIKDLNIFFKNKGHKKDTHAIRGLDLSLKEGEILGIVGESGCGKSLTNLCIMGLLPDQSYATWEQFNWRGNQYSEFKEKSWRGLRGSEIGMIFQNPMSSLNPTLSLEYQFEEIFKLHRKDLSKSQRKAEAISLLERVGITQAEKRLKSYPFELSGGMAQRVMIATVMATSPRLLIADEPTTALDVTIQNQVLDLIKDLSQENKMSVIFVTHDLAVVSHMADRINVMYAGEIVESASCSTLIQNPSHPYTHALLNSLPTEEAIIHKAQLKSIPGQVPSFNQRPDGCSFAPRCPYQKEDCKSSEFEQMVKHKKTRCLYPLNSLHSKAGALHE
jgi:oligopeptide/dipeptide ABC transporter ATP-binding protein